MTDDEKDDRAWAPGLPLNEKTEEFTVPSVPKGAMLATLRCLDAMILQETRYCAAHGINAFEARDASGRLRMAELMTASANLMAAVTMLDLGNLP